MDTYMTTVISNEKIADKIFRMELQGDIVEEMTTPGQFVNIKVNNSYEFLLRRPISICEINHEKIICNCLSCRWSRNEDYF